MKLNVEDKTKAGIYCIVNLVNNKVYIGKALDIYRRIKDHITDLNRKNTQKENNYLINSWHKHGKDNFHYLVLEYVEKDENLELNLKKKELYWQMEKNCTNRDKGYNLRLDSSTKMIVHDDTRRKCSESQKRRHQENPNARHEIAEKVKQYWENNPEARADMAIKVSKAKQKYNFLQYDKEMNLIKIWESVNEITEANPSYKWQQIYSVCNGHKPTIYGYIWRKELKI